MYRSGTVTIVFIRRWLPCTGFNRAEEGMLDGVMESFVGFVLGFTGFSAPAHRTAPRARNSTAHPLL